ncbi:TPM domain-containing protein [Parapedobacter indicus]|uniref:TLP18.3, Psb32 and MOLO-1 founding protein of phosphatase n=1 Tax=Parapedobacter indicus TaxID=1477437 RepID=A0A1I3T986_9SPHI|nr:TPM domain-containing protein [Parapedobacter indicus]PPK99580.1 TLP18.3/Psb32/MOLO-1 phosphatase superfamily protein [Parapedobacter indicus]SFJ67515.1 TLP18.3, Psb32 and MOLO-1 founding protein of phosphatase [Parapedobacter indicus]
MQAFTEEQQEKIVLAIQQAEARTSGEIRLAVEPHCKGEPLDRAMVYFQRLGMDKTAQHNGVLIYLATEDHQFAIVGDRGIHARVPADFWEKTKERMLHHFKGGDLVRGLIEGIVHAGEQLQHFFPREADDVNELPNDITFGDGKE